LHGTASPPQFKKLDAKGWAAMYDRVRKVPGLPPLTACVLANWAGGVPEKAVGGSAGAQLRKVWDDLKWYDFVFSPTLAAKAAGGVYEYAVTGGPKTIEHYCPGGPSVKEALKQLNAKEANLAQEVAVRGANHRKELIVNIEENVAQERRAMVRKAANVVMDGASGMVKSVTGFDTSTTQVALGVGAGVLLLGIGFFLYSKVRG
tara:strand:- start:679 stop:1290 length:612 start_codon:yes stop_codon:yes gene_type:complete